MSPTKIFALPTRALYSSMRFSWLSYLGHAEHERAASAPSRTSAVSYLATQALMRALAATRLEFSPTAAGDIAVNRSCLLCTSGKKHGKPRIEGVNFSMSQTSSLALGALGADALPLGLDVESAAARLFPGFSRVALSSVEKSLYESLDAQAQQRAGTLAWVAKEAILKVFGHGLSYSPARIDVPALDTLQVQARTACERIQQHIALERESLNGAVPELLWEPIDTLRVNTSLPAPVLVSASESSQSESHNVECSFYIHFYALRREAAEASSVAVTQDPVQGQEEYFYAALARPVSVPAPFAPLCDSTLRKVPEHAEGTMPEIYPVTVPKDIARILGS
ncbi:MAG: 4'-phosphopantetheinyl transferase superfamily protein [Rothia sp. (in: high G+C Gram-positive bacteria)]|uniref:4'-phosphopantetheinyl transferase family protein n=1 Tax=Rothia sp. (in: high G+C Gram-positive bacteria) TaxID=1885016 RepID=UPI0026DEA2DB|nr:4'-phosphopantetheinyl transferase superfamily protein [Rothia sp. (in: high G+C Gram-positive bacteria)]MDO5749820.1 4'-phosphopantetheinyl transferase superfamily protein [Rothia sp. (in: high G+C Gram-positive bacteria)]